MNKLILTALATSALSVSAFAQGTVSWAASGSFLAAQTNGSTYSSFSSVNPNGSTGAGSTGLTLGDTTANAATLGYNGYYYELLVSSTASSAPTTFAGLGAWSDTTLSATNSLASNGRIVETGLGGAGGVTGNTQATASNWAASTTENFILVGWSANLGTTWSQALADAQSSAFLSGLSSAAYWGVSTVGSLASASGNPGTTLFGTGAGQINDPSATPMNLEVLGTAPIPEPTTMALAAIGGASLLLFRRRK